MSTAIGYYGFCWGLGRNAGLLFLPFPNSTDSPEPTDRTFYQIEEDSVGPVNSPDILLFRHPPIHLRKSSSFSDPGKTRHDRESQAMYYDSTSSNLRQARKRWKLWGVAEPKLPSVDRNRLPPNQSFPAYNKSWLESCWMTCWQVRRMPPPKTQGRCPKRLRP